MTDRPILPTVALSIRQPWCHHILYDGKDIENRNWYTRFRGPVLIHAAKTPDGVEACRKLSCPMGGIVGVMDIVDCVDDSESHWFHGRYGFVIRNARPLQFLPCRGALNFFKPEIDFSELREVEHA